MGQRVLELRLRRQADRQIALHGLDGLMGRGARH